MRPGALGARVGDPNKNPMIRRLTYRRRGTLALAGLAAAACGIEPSDRRLLSRAPIPILPAPTPSTGPLPAVQLPRDEAPHDVLAEWWYYTGHLYAGAAEAGQNGGRRTDGAGDANGGDGQNGLGEAEEYGFELVFFRGVRGDRPPAYAAHFAVTDRPRQRFRYDQRVDVALAEGPGLSVRPRSSSGTARMGASPASAPGLAAGTPATARPLGDAASAASDRPAGVIGVAPAGGGFDLALGGWRMSGRDGTDRLSSTMPGYALDVALQAVRPTALHLGEPPLQPGLISFGPAGYSYYYSRTRMDLAGTLEVDGVRRSVHGLAWMDHQWGDFLVLGGGGWDWFAGNLADGRDLTLSLVRDDSGATVLAYGTLVESNGEVRHLLPESFRIEPTAWWTSPHTRVRYPSSWRLTLPREGLDLLWVPLLEDQELDTRASSGVIYWEGAVALLDATTRSDLGRGYVELTGYTER